MFKRNSVVQVCTKHVKLCHKLDQRPKEIVALTLQLTPNALGQTLLRHGARRTYSVLTSSVSCTYKYWNIIILLSKFHLNWCCIVSFADGSTLCLLRLSRIGFFCGGGDDDDGSDQRAATLHRTRVQNTVRDFGRRTRGRNKQNGATEWLLNGFKNQVYLALAVPSAHVQQTQYVVGISVLFSSLVPTKTQLIVQ